MSLVVRDYLLQEQPTSHVAQNNEIQHAHTHTQKKMGSSLLQAKLIKRYDTSVGHNWRGLRLTGVGGIYPYSERQLGAGRRIKKRPNGKLPQLVSTMLASNKEASQTYSQDRIPRTDEENE